MGYKANLETEDEYFYIKRKESSLDRGNIIKNKDISNRQYEDCDMVKNEFYQVNLGGSSYSNSNLMNAQIINCNYSYSRFQNINFQHSLYVI